MTRAKSHWTLGRVCINPDDRRLLVPLPCNLGLAVNFGHRHSVRFLFWNWAALILGLHVAPILAHPSYFAKDLTPLFWVLLANLAAIGIIRLNGCFTWADYGLLPIFLSAPFLFGLLSSSLLLRPQKT